MVYVGKFNEQDLRNGVDKAKVEQMKKESNGKLRYVKTKVSIKKGYMKVWLMTTEEYMNSNII